MIYFTNVNPHTPHMMFVGRWAPFHKGHVAIIQKKMNEHKTLPVLIMVRDTDTDAYSSVIRAEYIKQWMTGNNIHGTIMIIPNIEGIYWGRGVGYTVGVVDVDDDIKKISGTSIRQDMKLGVVEWEKKVAHAPSSHLLSPIISKIIEYGFVVWLTGCPSSGKTTIANDLLAKIRSAYPYLKTQLLDGDDMRASPLAQNVGFTSTDRAQHIRRMAYLAKMFADHGIFTVCAFVSPDRTVRRQARRIIGSNRFIEAYVHASKSTRIKRDAKGMYKMAMAGKIKNLTGYNAPYQVSKHPDVNCDTEHKTVRQSTEAVMNHIFR